MIDFVLADSPTAPPYKCYVCGNARGKMIDTNMFDDLDRRIYICKTRCVKRCAQLVGYAPGEKMEQLENAEQELEQAKLEIEARNERIEKLTGERASLTSRVESLEGLLAAERNKTATLHHQAQILSDNARELQTIMAG